MTSAQPGGAPVRRPPVLRARHLLVGRSALLALLAIALAIVPSLTRGEPALASASPVSSWTTIGGPTKPDARRAGAMAYDPVSARTILFGGTSTSGNAGALGDTWSWDGAAWTKLAPATAPSARTGSTLAYDPATAQLLLFGGYAANGARLGDTWRWTGSTWTQLSPATSPTPRGGAVLEWDPATKQMVLFGGNDASAYRQDTWLWDGSNWTAPTVPGPLPTGRAHGSLTYDPSSGQLVLFGGSSNGTTAFLADTWTWNGTKWTQIVTSSGPDGRWLQSAAFDPRLGEVILYGGAGAGSTVYDDTWSWSGSSWSHELPSVTPTGRAGAAAVFDPRLGQLVLFGGYVAGASSNLQETLAFGADPRTALAWSRAATTGPSGRAGSAVAFDGATGQLLLFGGYTGSNGSTLLQDTWAWNGRHWVNVSPSASPPARKFATMSFDPATGQLLLYGGSGAAGDLGDVWSWTWNGSSGTWTDITPTGAGPGARWGAGMGYDPAHAQMLLYGGQTGSLPALDTWKWTGAAWSQLSTGGLPGRQVFASLVFDSASGTMRLQGGAAGTSRHSDGFVWDGATTWTRATAASPGNGSAVDFDPVAGGSILWDAAGRQTSRFKDGSWSQLDSRAAPPAWSGGDSSRSIDGDTSGVFDPATGQFVVVGGWTAPSSYATDTWALTFQPEVGLQSTGTTALSASATLTGYDRAVSSALPLQALDTYDGWSLSVSADRNPTNGSGASLPAVVITDASATTSSGTTRPSPRCLGTTCWGNAANGAGSTYPVTVPTTGSALLWDSAGNGRLGLDLQAWFRVPATTRTGTYTSTVTFTATSGP